MEEYKENARKNKIYLKVFLISFFACFIPLLVIFVIIKEWLLLSLSIVVSLFFAGLTMLIPAIYSLYDCNHLVEIMKTEGIEKFLERVYHLSRKRVFSSNPFSGGYKSLQALHYIDDLNDAKIIFKHMARIDPNEHFYARPRYSDYAFKYYFHLEFQNILWEFVAKKA